MIYDVMVYEHICMNCYQLTFSLLFTSDSCLSKLSFCLNRLVMTLWAASFW